MTETVAWPFALDGVVESVTTTPEPSDGWNVAALGVSGLDGEDTGPEAGRADTDPTAESARARTWGRTRTRANFERAGRGVVQAVDDPVVFVRAALDRWVHEGPHLDEAAAWVAVEAIELERGRERGTEWVDWKLVPTDTAIRRRVVPRASRGFPAVVEMTVAASRLGVPAFDQETLRSRLEYFARVAERCGGERERAAVTEVAALSPWTPADGHPNAAAHRGHGEGDDGR